MSSYIAHKFEEHLDQPPRINLYHFLLTNLQSILEGYHHAFLIYKNAKHYIMSSHSLCWRSFHCVHSEFLTDLNISLHNTEMLKVQLEGL